MADKNKFLGVASLLLAALLYGLYGVFSRFIGMDFGIFFQAFIRNLIVFSAILIYFLWRGGWQKVDRDDYKWFVIMTVPDVFATVAVFVAFNNLAIGTTYFVNYVSITLGSYLLGKFFFGEKLTKIKLVSLAFCLLGLSIIFSVGLGRDNVFYAVLAALAGLGTASWNIFSKKVSSKYSLAQVLSLDCLIAMIITLPLAFVWGDPISWPKLSLSWLAIALYAAVAMGAGLSIINGFRRLEAQVGSLIMPLEPVFGVVFAWLFFKEVLTLKVLAGGVLILVGAFLPNLMRNSNGFN